MTTPFPQLQGVRVLSPIDQLCATLRLLNRGVDEWRENPAMDYLITSGGIKAFVDSKTVTCARDLSEIMIIAQTYFRQESFDFRFGAKNIREKFRNLFRGFDTLENFKAAGIANVLVDLLKILQPLDPGGRLACLEELGGLMKLVEVGFITDFATLEHAVLFLYDYSERMTFLNPCENGEKLKRLGIIRSEEVESLWQYFKNPGHAVSNPITKENFKILLAPQSLPIVRGVSMFPEQLSGPQAPPNETVSSSPNLGS